MPSKRKESKNPDARVSTGVAGLDEIMNQGFVPQRVYLVRGGPGSGKSTLGLHFLAVGASGLADNIVFLRYLEMAGEMRRAIGVLKKRTSSFEKTLREFEITSYGLKVGEPLTGLRGILSGGITLGKMSED